MKRLTVFLDGTWQKLDQPDPTNIAKLAQSVAHTDSQGTEQIVYYDRGVGADSLTHKATKRMISGITGEGLEDSLMNAYMFLCWNYTTGDEIYIFGFSRGAFTARSLCGLIRNAGLLHRPFAEMASEAYRHYRSKHHPDVDESAEFRKNYSYDPIPITYVGVFDTVGQRGIPSNFGPIAWLWNRRLQFHDLALSARIQSARHACAIDELRGAFPVTPWENLDELNRKRSFDPADPKAPYQQRWFPGSHGEVGGGVGSKLANITLDWVAKGAAMCGLEYTRDKCPLLTYTAPELQDPFAELVANRDWLSVVSGRKLRVLKRYKRPAKPAVSDISMMLSDAAIKRWRHEMKPAYRPAALKRFAKFIDENAQG
jgi:uncharacterized protein (DUF2235 family)